MAFYAVGDGNQPMTLMQVVAYVWLGQAFLGLLPFNVDTEIAGMIRSGAVSYEFVRPLDLYNFWFCRTIALRTAPTTLRCIPMLLFAIIVLPLLGLDNWALQLPADLVAFLCFLVSISLAVILATAITMLMHVVLVWTLNGEGINRIAPAIMIVLSGNVLPLPLFPDWLQPFLELQPFQGLDDTPFRIYCGDIRGADIVVELFQQAVWSVVFILWGRQSLSRIGRQLLVQGG